MTTAVCLKCGKMKFGAWVPCPKCGFAPENDEDKIKSIYLSDHNLSREGLEEVSQAIVDGKTINFPEEELKQGVEEMKNMPPPRVGRACFTLIAILLVIIASVIGLIAYLGHSH
jgi:hypothetical protein